EIFADASLRQPVQQHDSIAWPSRGFSVHVIATGLQPGRDHWYRFTCGNAVSRVGHTRTAPAPDAGVRRLRLALASCQHYEQGFFAAHRDIAAQDLDFVLFVGDYIYEGSSPAYTARQHGSPTPHTLDAYRARHALYKGDADLQAAHAAHAWIVTLDDHEVVNDYTADREPGHDDTARFLRRRAAAYRAYFEHMPMAIAPEGPALRIHDRFTWGRLAELWTLDTRQHRSHHACPDPQRDVGRSVTGCAELADPARTMLGGEQERWLQGGLAASSRRWKLLGAPIVASEFIGGSVTSRGAGQGAMARMRRDNPDVRHARGDERGWALVEATPSALHCEMRTASHPVTADAKFAVQARFSVEAGRAELQPA
ncbi:MAG: hypothetical protein EOO24_24670, partial [Comamonadaceae bacterium]